MAEFKPAPLKPTISFTDLDRVEQDEVARALIQSVTHIAGSADVPSAPERAARKISGIESQNLAPAARCGRDVRAPSAKVRAPSKGLL